jgi:hypothetical protein
MVRRIGMKNKISFTLVGLALVFSILACNVTINDTGGSNAVLGSGTVIEADRSVSNITGVELTMQGTLHITTGASESLRIEAEDNLMEYIQTEVRLGKLVIGTRPGINLHPNRPINYYLTVTGLSSVVISSSGDIETDDQQSGSFSITISSSGNLSISSLDCTTLQVKISSSGDVKITKLVAETTSVTISSSGNLDILGGQVQQQDITISSSGEYHARDLESVTANVVLSSSGEATIRVSDHLGGRLSSSGNINYSGNPDVSISMTSSGRAIQIP